MADLTPRQWQRKGSRIRRSATVEELAGVAEQGELFTEIPPLPKPARSEILKLPEVAAFLKAIRKHVGEPADINIRTAPRRRRAR